MIKEFKDKVAVITGAGSGIGRSLAYAFAERGMKVVIADVNNDTLKSVSDELQLLGSDVLNMVIDVSDRAQVAELADAAFDRFGKVNVLCNNAGTGARGPLHALELEDWDWGLGVNLFGVIYGIKWFLPRMREFGEPGHIVNTASMAGLVFGGGQPYGAAKAAVIKISESLLSECSNTNIGVSVLCPGTVNTDIIKNTNELIRSQPGLFQLTEETKEIMRLIDENLQKMLEAGISPTAFANRVIKAIEQDIFYIFSDSNLFNEMRIYLSQLNDTAQKFLTNGQSKQEP